MNLYIIFRSMRDNCCLLGAKKNLDLVINSLTTYNTARLFFLQRTDVFDISGTAPCDTPYRLDDSEIRLDIQTDDFFKTTAVL